MGSPISPGTCNTYCEDFEQRALQTAPTEICPSLWLRYVDDVVAIITEKQVTPFTDHINTINPSMQFTVETQVEEGKIQHLPVLDVDIIRKEDGVLNSKSTKRKLIQTNI